MSINEEHKIEHDHHIVLYTGAEEWTALYVDGELASVGDGYLQDEYLQQMFGVEWRHTDDYLQGGTSRDGVAHTLEGAEAYAERRQERLQQATALRNEAAELLAKANSLEET